MKSAGEISIIKVFNSKYQNIYLSGKNCEDIQFVMWKEVSLGRKRVDRSYQILSGTKFCPSSYSMTFTLICKTNTTAAGNTSWPNIKKTGKKKSGAVLSLHIYFCWEKEVPEMLSLADFLASSTDWDCIIVHMPWLQGKLGENEPGMFRLERDWLWHWGSTMQFGGGGQCSRAWHLPERINLFQTLNNNYVLLVHYLWSIFKQITSVLKN